MFNDFKNLTYKTTKQKISKLKDIFDRLNLSSLEERLNTLSNLQESLEIKRASKAIITSINPGIPENPSDLADLIILSINTSLQPNYINFEITIKNIGTIASSTTLLNEIIPDLLNNTVSVPILESEETFTTNIQFSFDPTGTPVTKTFLTEVNPLRSLLENSYSNNSMSSIVEVKSEYVPDINTYVILHAHNPEGKEIVPLSPISESLKFKFYGGDDCFLKYFEILPIGGIENHGGRWVIQAGHYDKIECYYNGITIDLGPYYLQPHTTSQIVATFTRYNMPLSLDYSGNSGNMNNFIIPAGFYLQTPPCNTSPIFAICQAYDEQLSQPSIYGYGTFEFYLNDFGFMANLEARWLSNPPGKFPFYQTIASEADVPISIPTQTAFHYWISQSKVIGKYPSISLINQSGGSSDLIMSSPNIYRNLSLPANVSYNALRTDISVHSLYTSIANMSTPVSTKLAEGTLIWKASSIPYDLAGTSF
jgi:hypothetical protein